MPKMICLAKNSWPPTATVLNFSDEDVPVILILDAKAAVKVAMDHFHANESRPKRLATNYQTLSTTGTLYIPMLHVNFDGTVEFSDGRHRSLTLDSMGFATVPVLTSLKNANTIQHLWGSIATANTEYDFPDPHVTKFIGI